MKLRDFVYQYLPHLLEPRQRMSNDSGGNSIVDGNDDNYCLPSKNCGNTATAITNLEIVGKYKYKVGK